MNNLIEQLDLYFGKKAPQMPAGFKEGIVKFLPYLVIVGLIFAVFGVFAFIPMLLVSVLGGFTAIMQMVVAFLTSVVVGILELMALPGLFKRTPASWKLLFYVEIVTLISALLSYNVVGFIISGVIGFYILFQIRPYYNGVVPAENTNPTPAV